MIVDGIPNLTEGRKVATVRDAMTLLDVSRPTVMKWIEEGKFPNAIKSDGRTGGWHIPRCDIERTREELISDLQSQIESLRQLASIRRE